jgi:hypothetical protein
MWIDPEREMFVILLTNRVHAARALRPAKVISDVRADLSDAAVLSVLDGPKVSGSRSFRADREVGWNPPPRRASRRRHSSSRHHTIASATSRSRASAAKKTTSGKKAVKKSTKKH